MKTILTVLLLGALALLVDLPLAGLGLVLVASVLLIGDLVQGLPATACNQNCHQGDDCACARPTQERTP